MQVAKKSPRKLLRRASGRATLTLSAETYDKIDRLRGQDSRSAFIQRLVAQEEQRGQRERFVAQLRREYTAAVSRETLVLNQEFPIHEK